MFRINFRLVGGVDRSLSDICVFTAIEFISRLGPRELSRTLTAEISPGAAEREHPQTGYLIYGNEIRRRPLLS